MRIHYKNWDECSAGPDTYLQSIAKDKSGFNIKWFSPLMEIDLCGHATLAAAHIYFSEINPDATKISFNSNSGILNVHKEDAYLYLDFPADVMESIDIDDQLIKMLGLKPIEAFKGRDDFMCIFKSLFSSVS